MSKIVAVMACPTGIAHTVMAAEALEKTAKAMGHTLRAEIWRNLVLPTQVPSQDNQTFDVYAIYDPRFAQPWLLATPLKLRAESVRTIFSTRPIKAGAASRMSLFH